MSALLGRDLSVRSWSVRGVAACVVATLVLSLFPTSLLTAQVGPASDTQHAPRFFLAMNGGRPEPMDASRVPVLRQRLALDLEGVTLKQAITAISRQSGLIIWYSDDVLRRNTPVHLRADAITVAAALTDVLMDAGVDVVFSRDGTASLVKRTATAASAQVGIIAGRATDSTSREGIGGVTIAVEGTRLSTTTAVDGAFTIRGVPAGNRTITARRLGFVRQARAVTVADNEPTTVDFVLVQAPTTLTEVVTTATGEQRRVELGHVVGRINADSVVKAAPVSSVSELLNGRVPGLRVDTYQGTVGGEVSLQVRSPNTIQLGTDPIIIVDGIRYTGRAADRVNAGSLVNIVEPTSPLNDLNPNEIESIEVVKGPSAATLYGTDAANGVIVITTKRGRSGPARWNGYVRGAVSGVPTNDYLDAYWGWHSGRDVPLSFPCALWLVGRGVCIQDSVTVIRNPLNDPARTIFAAKPRWEYGANVAGGTERFRYFVTGDLEQSAGPLRMPPAMADSISRERTVPEEQLEPNALSKLNLRANLDIRLGRGAELQVNAGYVQREARTLGSGFASPYPTVLTRPTPANPFGTGPEEWFARTTTERNSRLYASATGRWSPAVWLLVRMVGGVDLANLTRSSLVRRGDAPSALFNSFALGAVADDRGRQLATTGEVAATASFSSGRLSSRTSVGAQYVRTLDDMLGSSGTNLTPGGSTIGAAASVQSRQNYREQVTLGSYVEQAVGLNQRLFLTGAVRMDGASTFGRNYAAAAYPKASVSWLMSEEPLFPRVPLLNELRLRYAFGASGQQPRPEWARRAYAVVQRFHEGTLVNVYRITSLGNSDLRPERVSEHEFGFDASVVASRVNVELTWFRRKTVDQIVGVTLPPGFGTVQTNLGRTTGRGFEALISARLIDTRALSWHVQLQHSVHRTTLEELGGAAELRSTYGGWVEGYPLGARFVRPLLGYDDANGDGIIDPFTELQFGDTLVFAGESRAPRSQSLLSSGGLFGGRIRLSALVERRSGFTQRNSLHKDQCGNFRCRAAVDPSTPLAEQARAVAVFPRADYAFIEPGDFTRLREVGVAIELPNSLVRALRLRSATLGVQGRNLALWTDYSGGDPESSSIGLSLAQEIGIPQGRSWVVRLDLGF